MARIALPILIAALLILAALAAALGMYLGRPAAAQGAPWAVATRTARPPPATATPLVIVAPTVPATPRLASTPATTGPATALATAPLAPTATR